MLKLGPMLIATAFLTIGAEAWAHDPPLFAAFKAFCIDTGANPDAMKSAVEAAGGKQHGAGATEHPFKMTVTTWDVTAGGASLNVSPTRRLPRSKSGQREFKSVRSDQLRQRRREH